VERLTVWERLRRVNPYVWDATLALVVFVGSVLAGSSYYSTAERRVVRSLSFDLGSVQVVFNGSWGAVLLTGAACALLVWRRRWPIGTLYAVAIAVGAYQFSDHQDGLVATPAMIAVYTAAAHRERERVLTVALPASLAIGLMIALVGGDPRGRIEFLFILLVVVVLPLLLGRIAFNRRRRIRRDRDRAARDAVMEERARIARELHDVVAHAMGVMVVQAGAARVVIDRDPAGTEAALKRIEDTGRTGLTEMRRLLGILQADEGSEELVPQPGLDRLDELLATMRGIGLPVEAMVEGTPRALPPGVDLTAYRLVQEGLTNALKHAGPAHARVLLRYRDEALEVEVADDGRGPPLEGARRPGHGLIGMRERVGLFGGSFETGVRPGGGFVVRARIPLAEAP
jgi:signal transduction histidine kinase